MISVVIVALIALVASIQGQSTSLPYPYATPNTTQCTAFCTLMMTNCSTIYASMSDCMAYCAVFPLGSPFDTSGDSFYCRAYHANASLTLGSFHCPHAGVIGGNGVCGTAVDAYCHMTNGFCTQYGIKVSAWCNIVAGNLTYAGVSNDTYMDTLDCRLYHIGVAITTNTPQGHCNHSALAGGDVCGTKCDAYCNFLLENCPPTTSGNSFATKAQCLAACAVLPPGFEGTDTYQDTLGCRFYHTTVSFGIPSHCVHSGANGLGICGSNQCDSYCVYYMAACGGTQAECSARCNAAPMNGTYPQLSGNWQECLTYHAVAANLAPGNAAIHCPHANGSAVCVNSVASSTATSASSSSSASSSQSGSGSGSSAMSIIASLMLVFAIIAF
jgi:hypothetical protein